MKIIVPRNSSCISQGGRDQRGAVLVTAMVFAIIIGIALVTYMKLSNTSLNLAQRNMYDNSAMNLAETGLEKALYCLHQNQVSNQPLTTAWPTSDGWSANTGTHIATNTFSGFNVGPNTSGSVKVYVQNYDASGTIKMVTKSSVALGDGGPPLSKYIEVTLSKRNLFGGLVARTSFTADSGLLVDSWISTDPATGIFSQYSNAVSRPNGPLGVVSNANGALNLNDSFRVYGTVGTGGGSISKASGVLANTVGGSGWNAALVNTAYNYTFPTITVPSPSAVNTISSNITASVSFPRVGDVPASDGKYYYNFATTSSIQYASNTMTITQPVVFIITGHSGTNAIYTSAAATFTYGTGPTDNGSFALYTDGNINFDSGANWFVNKAPINTAIYGTNATAQTFATRGSGNFYGQIIAPNAAIVFDAGTSLMGGFSANTVRLLGNVSFHYDEALGQIGGGGYKVTKWKELRTAAERATYSSALAF
jgi:Tfp pilus assembly protein PilX